MSRFFRAFAVVSIVTLNAAGALAQTAASLSVAQEMTISAATTPAACRDAVLQIVASDPALLEPAARFATTNCPDTSIALLAETLAARFPDQIENLAVAMTAARPEAIAEIILSFVGGLPEAERVAAFERIVERIRRDIPGIVDTEAFAALPGVGGLTGPAFSPYLFPLLLEESSPLAGPGGSVSPS